MKNFYSVASKMGLLTSLFSISLFFAQVRVPSQDVKSAVTKSHLKIDTFPKQKPSKDHPISLNRTEPLTSTTINRANKKYTEQIGNNEKRSNIIRSTQQATTEEKSPFKATNLLAEEVDKRTAFSKSVKYADESFNKIKPSKKQSRNRKTNGKLLQNELTSNINVPQNVNAESINSRDYSQLSPLQSMVGKAEDFSKRDASSKHFKNADGSYTAVIGSEAIHYRKNGQFLDIDHAIVSSSDASYPFANTTNLFESYFGATSNQGIKSKTSKGEIKEFLNTKMYWEVNGKEVSTVQSSNSRLIVKENEGSYKNMYGTISAEFLIGTSQRKLNYIIPDKKALGNIPDNANFLVFQEEIILPIGWTHSNSLKGIVIKNELNEEVFTYSNPYSTDFTNELSREKNTVFEATQIGYILTIKTKVKTEWLLNSQRKFPVKIDPTVSVFANGGRSVASDGFEETLGFFGAVSGYFTQYHIKFNVSAIPNGSTVNSTTGFFYEYGVGGTVHTDNRWQWDVSADPTTTTGTTLYNSANAVLSNPTAISNAATWRSAAFLNGAPLTYVVNGINSNTISATIRPAGTYNYNNFYAARTHNDINFQPYLSITYTAPSCALPTNLNVDTITATSARFTWNAASPAPAQGYDYYYNTTGVAPISTSTPIVNVGAGVTTGAVTGLNSNTVYHFWIRSKCSASSSSVWVYGGYFNTNPAQNCFQGDGQIKGAVHNGYTVTMSGQQRVADDIIVPATQQMTVKQISIEALSTANITNAIINIRNDNNGVAGTVLATVWNNTAPTASSTSYTTAFGLNTYHLLFNLPANFVLPAGKYWVEISMKNATNTDVYWRTTKNGMTGGFANLSLNGGTTWAEEGGLVDMVFYMAGNCVALPTCDPVSASANKYVVCAGDAVQLSANSSTLYTSYNWYTDWNNNTHSGTLVGTGQTITVNPTQSRLYGVVATNSTCPGINNYALITVSVTPPPSLIVMDPIDAITCSGESREISVVSGGIIPESILNETWDPIPQNPWIVYTQVIGGSGTNYARWGYTNEHRGITRPDNSNFMVVDSDAYGQYEMESSLISPPLNFSDYNGNSTNITLTFEHLYWNSLSDVAIVEITTDGTNWNELKQYASDQGSPPRSLNFISETLDLTAYKGQPYCQIRFRYHANYSWFWAVDNIKVTGTNPLPTTITWTPTTGLWRDAARTIPYDGNQATTLYASPASTTTYTISAKTSVGCPAKADVTVERGNKDWSGSSQNWNTASNWSEGTIPTADHCVNIPSNSNKPIILTGTDAFAKNLTIQSDGNLQIAGNLTVTDFVRNLGATDDLTVKSDGNLIQINPLASNSGNINAERDVTDMDNVLATQMDYVYWSSPVTGQQTKGLGGFSPGTPSNRFFRYNEPNDNFYETGDPTFVPGKGYAVQAETSQGYAPNATGYSKTYNFRGTPHNGDIAININRSPDAGLVQHGFNLVGNPYPSNIDFDKLYTANAAKIYNVAYFWTNNNYEMSQQGSAYGGNNYAVYNGVGGNSATHAASGTGVTAVPNGIIKVGQGFIIQKSVVGGPVTLDFKNSYGSGQDLRVTTSSTFFQKDGAEKNRFWINLTSPAGLINTQLIGYIPGATEGYDPDYDAEIFGMSSDVFYSKAGDKNVLIQGKGDFVVSDKVLLGANIFKNGNYTINLNQAEGIFASGQNIYLKDLLSGIVTNLSEGSYTFAATAGLSEGRFEIIYEPQVFLSTDGSAKEELVIYRDGNDFVVKAQSKKITYVEVYDTGGRLIYTMKANGTQVVIPAEQLPSSVYIVKITQTEAVTSRKILK